MQKLIAVKHNPKTQRVDIVQVYIPKMDRTYEGDALLIDGVSSVHTGFNADLNVTCWIETDAELTLSRQDQRLPQVVVR